MQASPGMTSHAKPWGPAALFPDRLGSGIALGLLAVGAVVALGRYGFPVTAEFSWRSLLAYAAGAGLVALFARSRLAPCPFGAANVVTLIRGALIAPLLALGIEQPDRTVAWLAIAIAVIALVLDGIDGRIARRSGQASRFGARFDMETDALLILTLAMLCWQFGKAGAWILIAGLLRYAFVAAGLAVERLRRPLPASRRRQTVCVVQVVALLLCLAPMLAPPWSAAAGAAGLAVLVWSFLVDVVWLARRS
jgi:phosphatidylglycerophosphate synthase